MRAMIKSLNTTNTELRKVCFVTEESKHFQKCLDLYLPIDINPVPGFSTLLFSLIRKNI